MIEFEIEEEFVCMKILSIQNNGYYNQKNYNKNFMAKGIADSYEEFSKVVTLSKNRNKVSRFIDKFIEEVSESVDFVEKDWF